MLAVLATLMIQRGSQPQISPADYFPMAAGQRRYYQTKDSHAVTIDEVGEPVTVGGEPAWPVTSSSEGANSTAFYRITSRGVYLVAYRIDEPIEPPLPVFQLGSDSSGLWNYLEEPQVGKGVREPLMEQGSLTVGPDQNVLGKKLATIVSHVDAEVGDSLARERISQTSVFAKGVGLVSMQTRILSGRKWRVTETALVKMENGRSKR